MAQTPKQWVEAFWPTAKAAGIKRATYDRALGNFTPDPDVLKRAAAQAEFNMAIWNYIDQMVSDERRQRGRGGARHQHADLLQRSRTATASTATRCSPSGGWRATTAPSSRTRSCSSRPSASLATLAYSGGRLAKFGRQQLVAALKIVQRGDVSVRRP